MALSGDGGPLEMFLGVPVMHYRGKITPKLKVTGVTGWAPGPVAQQRLVGMVRFCSAGCYGGQLDEGLAIYSREELGFRSLQRPPRRLPPPHIHGLGKSPHITAARFQQQVSRKGLAGATGRLWPQQSQDITSIVFCHQASH